MSNIYITEPNTEGKVLLHTTFGDLDVELWPQQAPKACRNFVQLCLEGYYDDTIFHRIIAGFMVQGGDPTGTGNGGESIYDGAFIDEFHSRLKFNHRGIVAMANENKPNSNHSQFFFTLDACEFLEKKHTIFGKITGNTIFNLLSVGDVETDAQDRPLHPPKLLSTEVLWNPFEDIVPREIQHKKSASSAAEEAAKKKKRERKATKDLKLLSFGDEEEEFQQEVSKKKSKKAKKLMSSHDLLDDKKLKAQVDEELLQKIAETTNGDTGGQQSKESGDGAGMSKKEAARASLKAAVASAAARKTTESTAGETSVGAAVNEKDDAGTEAALKKQEKKHKSRKSTAGDDAQDEYTRLREELRASKKAAPVLMGSKAKEQDDAKAFHDMLTPLQQQRQKYLQKKKASSRSGRQQETLQKLMQFKAKLEGVNKSVSGGDEAKGDSDSGGNNKKKNEAYHGQILDEDSSDDGDVSGSEQGGDGVASKNQVEKEKDLSWMTAKLKFKKHIDDQFRAGFDPSADNYMTIDTRNEKARDGSRSTRRPSGRAAGDRSRSRDRRPRAREHQSHPQSREEQRRDNSSRRR